MTARQLMAIVYAGSLAAFCCVLPFAVPTPNYYPDSSLKILTAFQMIGWGAGGVLAFIEWVEWKNS